MSWSPRTIPNDRLILSEVPTPESDWEGIQRFALTFDGYKAFGHGRCGDLANARNAGTLPEAEQSLSVLRGCLFFEQRRWSHLGEAPEGKALNEIRSLVAAIRQRVGVGPQSDGEVQPSGMEVAMSSASVPYATYDQVPVFRKQWFFWLAWFAFAPLAIGILVSGDVYYQKKGEVRRLGIANRIVAGLIALLWTYVIVEQMMAGPTSGT